jgi:hypothetical protein
MVFVFSAIVIRVHADSGVLSYQILGYGSSAVVTAGPIGVIGRD